MLNMSINTLKRTCTNCGAPLEGYICLYCDSNFGPSGEQVSLPEAADGRLPTGLFEVRLGDRRYSVLGQLAQGEHSRVLLARRASLVSEQVVLKVSRQVEILEKEWSTLRHLQGRCSYLDMLLPRPVARGEVRSRHILAYSWRSGFVHTLAYARKQYLEGVPAAAVVWMWNRILDQLSALHDLGYSHGDLSLEHLLVHPRDHGIAFCGWGKARLGGQGDLAQSGRVVLELLGPGAPGALVNLAEEAGCYRHADQLQQGLKRVAEAVFGPPRFVPFALPRA